MDSSVEVQVFKQISDILEDSAKKKYWFLLPWYHDEPCWILRPSRALLVKNMSTISAMLMEKDSTWPGYFYLLLLAEVFKEEKGWEEIYRDTVEIETEVCEGRRLTYRVKITQLEEALREAFKRVLSFELP